MPAQLRVGVAGAGHFGRYHALKVASSSRARLVGIHDHNPAHAERVAQETGTPAMSLPDLLAACDALIIAVPAVAHYRIAAPALRAGKHVLVEKPFAATMAEADALAALAAEHGCILQVGHLERFSVPYAALESQARTPVYIEAARTGPFSRRGADVSVVLDLMIHDLDLVLALTGSTMQTMHAVGLPVISRHPDIAHAHLRLASGAVASLTASRVSVTRERRMRVFTAERQIDVDFANRRLRIVRRDRGEPCPALPGFGMEEIAWDNQDALAAEQEAFFAAVAGDGPVLVDAAAGRNALALALAVSDAIAAGSSDSGLDQLEHGFGRFLRRG